MTACISPKPTALDRVSSPTQGQQSSTAVDQPLDQPSNWLALGTLTMAATIALAFLLVQQQWDLNLFSAAGFRTAAENAGYWGPLLYMLLLIVSVVVSQLPGAGLAIAAGAIWGPLLAGIYTVIGGFLGAVIAYGLGRAIGPRLLTVLTGKSIRFSQERGEPYLGGLIFLMRLVPLFSFDLISYGAGIAKLSFPLYAGATLLGMIPSTLMLTYAGSAFQLSEVAIAGLAGLALAGFVLLPWAIRRHNWLNLANIVQID